MQRTVLVNSVELLDLSAQLVTLLVHCLQFTDCSQLIFIQH